LGKSRETALIPNKKGAALGFYATHMRAAQRRQALVGIWAKRGDGQY
jgi:hypothetical protein